MSRENRLLVFTLRDAEYALKLGQVAEVIEDAALHPIPRAPSYFAGIMNFHGELTPVLDMASFFHAGEAKGNGRLIVLDRGIASLALRVERVVGIFPGENILEEHPPEEEMIAKILQLPDGEVKLVDPASLVAKIEERINEQL